MTAVTDLPATGGNTTSVAFLPDHSIVAVMDGQLYSFDAQGKNRQVINDEAVHTTLAVAPTGEIYAATQSAIRIYNRITGAFTTTAPLPTSNLRAINLKFSPSGKLIVITTDNYPRGYAYTTPDNGATWKPIVFLNGSVAMSGGGEIAFTPSGAMLAADASSLQKSTDGGATWTLLTTNVPNSWGVQVIAITENDILTYAAGGNNARISHDGGVTFTNLSSSLYTSKLMVGSDHTVYGIINTSSLPNAVEDRPSELARSTDMGQTWTHLVFGYGISMAMDGQSIVMGIRQSDLTTSSGGMYLSTNSGAIWSSSGTTTVDQITDFSVGKNDQLLINASHTLYRYNGTSWEVLGGIPQLDQFSANSQGSIAVFDPTTTLYSSDNGVSWRSGTVPRQVMGPGRPHVPAYTRRANGDFVFCVTEYRDDLSVETNGRMFKLSSDGVPTALPNAGGNFVRLSDESSAMHGLTVNFSDRLISLDGGATWKVDSSDYVPMAFNSQNTYFNILGKPLLGKFGQKPPTTLNITGASDQVYQTKKAEFNSKDQLYLLLNGKVYYSNNPLR